MENKLMYPKIMINFLLKCIFVLFHPHFISNFVEENAFIATVEKTLWDIDPLRL